MAKLSETLKERGYVHQFSADKLEEITDGSKRTVYLGIDPSADSLHVGNLMGLLVLRRFLEDGHKVIILTGGGTGMIGDPGGKSEERNLLDEATIQANAEAVAAQIRRVFGSDDFIAENNAKWLSQLNLLEFLREVGKHFTVNSMIKKDTVAERLKKEVPMSFTEFSYSLLQAYDYLHLHEEYDCDAQVGGSDQWSNTLAGVDFIRRKKGDVVYALTWPLIVNKAIGKKFGKTESGAVWLDEGKTSVFDFYQFWLTAEDESIEEYLLKMTMLTKTEIDAALEMHRRDRKERHGQKLLAREVTTLVHGEEPAKIAESVSDVLFGSSSISELSDDARAQLRASAPSYDLQEGVSIIDALVGAQLASSRRAARQLLLAQAVSLNQNVIADAEYKLGSGDFSAGGGSSSGGTGLAILKRGKQKVCLLVLK